MAKTKNKPHFADEVIVPVISFLTILAGLLGLLGFLSEPLITQTAIITLLTSVIAIPAGIMLYRFQHLGWLISLIVIAISELLVLITHITVNKGFDPFFLVTFTLFYGAQAYYLIVRRELFTYPTYYEPFWDQLRRLTKN